MCKKYVVNNIDRRYWYFRIRWRRICRCRNKTRISSNWRC